MDNFRDFLELLNETLASIIVILSASLLLYNLSRNLRNRVARTSGAVLACVTAVYVGDVLVSLGPGLGTNENLLRMQWLGLAFIPTTLFHLSDALLATTGLPSRGRRRRAVRLLYGVGTVFLLLAAFTDWLVNPVAVDGRISLRPAPLFWLYLVYFVLINALAVYTVQRARKRCLTRSTQRRMAYLQAAMLTPSIGVFPYSVLLPVGEEFMLRSLILVNVANLLVIFMLLFLAYPLSFFGSRIPDRVVKAELLRFMLRGPATGMLALITIFYTVAASEFFSVPGEDFMPFAVVAAILLWQWGVDIALPWLERQLIYRDENDEQLAKLQNLSERLLTRSDLLQLLEATLEATCDYLQVSRAFVLRLDHQKPELIKSVGKIDLTNAVIQEEAALLSNGLRQETGLQRWKNYWVLPLHSARSTTIAGEPALIGLMGIEARAETNDLTEDEQDMLLTFVNRAAHTLDDILLQTEIYAALEGLLPQITLTRGRAAEVEYRPGRSDTQPSSGNTLDRDEVIEQVQAALRHYGGGPGLSKSRLLELAIVRRAMPEHERNPSRTLRAILTEAIENQRPSAEKPDMNSPEWTTYNILKLRFIDKRKVRETAQRLYMSEANLYRKQNIAIEAVADAIIKMERDALADLQQVMPQ